MLSVSAIPDAVSGDGTGSVAALTVVVIVVV